MNNQTTPYLPRAFQQCTPLPALRFFNTSHHSTALPISHTFQHHLGSNMSLPHSIRSRPLAVTEQQVDRWINANQHSKPYLARIFREHLSNRPTCQWLGEWIGNVQNKAREIAQHAQTTNSLYQVVVYNIPNRDVGGFSAGGAQTREAYLTWITQVAAGLGNVEGLIIIEPDALAHAAHMADWKREQRLKLIREATAILKQRCRRAHIYIDAGNPEWLSVETTVNLLERAGIRDVAGISLNVANSIWTDQCYEYGVKITQAFSEQHGFVIDTSRNGAGPPPQHVTGVDRWANPSTNRLGEEPTTHVTRPNNYSHRLHALLWIKTPGESDGDHNGAPRAGIFHPEGARKLLQDKL